MKRIERLVAFGGYKDITFLEKTLASECNKLEQWYITFLDNMQLKFECVVLFFFSFFLLKFSVLFYQAMYQFFPVNSNPCSRCPST